MLNTYNGKCNERAKNATDTKQKRKNGIFLKSALLKLLDLVIMGIICIIKMCIEIIQCVFMFGLATIFFFFFFFRMLSVCSLFVLIHAYEKNKINRSRVAFGNFAKDMGVEYLLCFFFLLLFFLHCIGFDFAVSYCYYRIWYVLIDLKNLHLFRFWCDWVECLLFLLHFFFLHPFVWSWVRYLLAFWKEIWLDLHTL